MNEPIPATKLPKVRRKQFYLWQAPDYLSVRWYYLSYGRLMLANVQSSSRFDDAVKLAMSNVPCIELAHRLIPKSRYKKTELTNIGMCLRSKNIINIKVGGLVLCFEDGHVRLRTDLPHMNNAGSARTLLFSHNLANPDNTGLDKIRVMLMIHPHRSNAFKQYELRLAEVSGEDMILTEKGQ